MPTLSWPHCCEKDSLAPKVLSVNVFTCRDIIMEHEQNSLAHTDHPGCKQNILEYLGLFSRTKSTSQKRSKETYMGVGMCIPESYTGRLPISVSTFFPGNLWQLLCGNLNAEKLSRLVSLTKHFVNHLLFKFIEQIHLKCSSSFQHSDGFFKGTFLPWSKIRSVSMIHVLRNVRRLRVRLHGHL